MFGITFKHLNRYSEFLKAAMRHGLGFYILNPYSISSIFIQEDQSQTNQANLIVIGQHLRQAFAELGPAFIKLGQLASTRSDILPLPIVSELSKLQDQVQPLPFHEIRWTIETSLKAKLEDIYSSFEPTPVAAASIAQIHYAVLKSGEKVIVKVQRPFIKEQIQTDLEIFAQIIGQLEKRFEWGKKYPLRKMLEEFSRTIQEELDFHNEGHNTEQLALLAKKDKEVVIPKVFWDYSTEQVLTLEFLNGVTLNKLIVKNSEQVQAENLPAIADQLAGVIMKQIFVHGVYHGDPHPGNVMLLPDGKMALLDFGIIGKLSASEKLQLASLLAALVRGDNNEIVKAIAKIGVLPPEADQTNLLKDITAFREKYLYLPRNELNIGKCLNDFFSLTFQNGIYFPSGYILVGKTLLTLEGIQKSLNSQSSLIEQAGPFIRRAIRGNLAPRFILKKLIDTWQGLFKR